MASSLTVLGFLLVVLFCTSISNTLALLVSSPQVLLSYHNGPLLSGPEPIKLSLTFYGDFEASERSTLRRFLASLSPSGLQQSRRFLRGSPLSVYADRSVSAWWSITQQYADLHGRHVSQRVEIVKEVNDDYSLGKQLKSSDIAVLARSSVDVGKPNSLALVFTSADVAVDGFCMHSCGAHSFTSLIDDGEQHAAAVTHENSGDDRVQGSISHTLMSYVWVGNSKLQCPGFCAWPFEKPQYGPDMAPLKPPNSVGVDGMIISLAKLLVSAATNPFGDAFYQGDDASYRPEAGQICGAKFGAGAYPGYPGKILQDADSGASYNMEGSNGERFMVPWIWDPTSKSCVGQPSTAVQI